MIFTTSSSENLFLPLSPAASQSHRNSLISMDR